MRAKHCKNKGFYNMLNKQTIISLLLVLCFVAVAIPKVAFSASMENLYVNGVNILTEETRTVQCGSGTATFDDASEVLTIENAEITHGVVSGSAFAGIVAASQSGLGFDGRLNLRIVGDNTITLDRSVAGNNERTGIFCNSRLYDGIILDYAEGATLTINFLDNTDDENVTGISASLGGVMTTDSQHGTLTINANVSSAAEYTNGISTSKTLLLNNIDVVMNGISTGVVMSSNDTTNRDFSLMGGSTLTMTPNSAEYYSLTGIMLNNGAYLNVDESTITLNKNERGNAFGTGIDITRQSSTDNSNYLIANNSRLNLNLNVSGYGIYLTGCDAEINNSTVNILSEGEGDTIGILAYPDWLAFAPQKVVLNGCATNISVPGTDIMVSNDDNTGSFIADGGSLTLKSLSSTCIEGDSISLNNLSANFNSEGSCIKQYGDNGKIELNSIASLSARSGELDEANTFDAVNSINIDTLIESEIECEGGSVFKAGTEINVVSAEKLNAHTYALEKACVSAGTSFNLTNSGSTKFTSDSGYGITVESGNTNVVNVEDFYIIGTKGIHQPNGEVSLNTITNITIAGVMNAIYNESGNILLNNVNGFGLKSANDVIVADKGNIVFSGGHVNIANDSNNEQKGLGLLAKESNIIFNEGSTINIIGKDGAIRADKGNIEVRDCTTIEPDTFSVNVSSLRNEFDTASGSEKLKPAIEATEGSISIINSRVFGHGLESEHVILAKQDITTNLGGVVYAEGGDFGIFTYGFYNMMSIDDEARVASTIGGIVSYRYKNSEADDTNGFNIASGLIDYNQKRELNVKNTGWIQGQSGICSMTTVAEQGVESIDEYLNGNDKNAWIKSGVYYTLEYKLAGGVWPLSDPEDPESERKNPNPDVYRADDPDITIIAPERDGYEFLGWTGTGLTELTKDVTISPTSGDVGSRVYTAVWTTGGDQTLLYVSSSIDRGTVSNDGETPIATASVAVGSTAKANPGYHFVNWTKKQFKIPEDPDDPEDPDNPDNPAEGNDNDPVNKAKELLFGKFAPNISLFTINSENNSEGEDTPSSGEDGDKPNHDEGEEVDPDEVKTDETEDVVVTDKERLIPKRKTGEVWKATVYFANFEGNNYKVRFDANGGSGIMLDQDYIYGIEGKLPLVGFSNGEYLFMGWSKSPSAEKAEYADGAQVINLTEESDGIVTLYAVWTLPYKGEPGNGSGYNLVYGASGIGGGFDASMLLGKTLYDLMGKALPPVGDPIGRIVYCVILLGIVGTLIVIIIYRKRKIEAKKDFLFK